MADLMDDYPKTKSPFRRGLAWLWRNLAVFALLVGSMAGVIAGVAYNASAKETEQRLDAQCEKGQDFRDAIGNLAQTLEDVAIEANGHLSPQGRRVVDAVRALADKPSPICK